MPPPPPRFIEFWHPVEEDLSGCPENGSRQAQCGAARGTCESNGYQVAQAGTDVLALIGVGGGTNAPGDGENFEGTRRDTELDSDSSLGYACFAPEEGSGEASTEPVVITVSQADFAELPVTAVNMEVVLHASGEEQVFETTILDTPVSVRAIPIEYEWDLGDGSTITTTKSGAPCPRTEIASTFRYEGWYDVTLTTTFAGQFSVDGGAWQDIDGTITVGSEPVGIFSKSLESRLVNGDVPVDEEADPWMPERSAETERPQDPDASHREI